MFLEILNEIPHQNKQIIKTNKLHDQV